MKFANPEFLLLFIFFIIPLLPRNASGTQTASVRFPRGAIFDKEKKSFKIFLRKILKFALYASFALIIIALARPQEGKDFNETSEQGIDIIMALDTSSSMSSLDFQSLNRLETAKNVSADFIKGRKSDRIGLVVFSGLAFTQCPLTTDKESLLSFVKNINIGDTGVDGTAIGSAIAASINRLKDSKAKEKILILITDGNNNMGEIEPVTASRIAANYGIKIYSVGVGSPEGAVYEVDDGFFGKRRVRSQEAKLNETILTEIAQNTGGKYFRASDIQSFKEIMQQIDKMEKDEIKVKKFTNYEELYQNFILAALILLCLTVILDNTYLRKLP